MPRFWWFLCLLLASLTVTMTSQTELVSKRRIGMRLPNMLHYRPGTIEKRRIGMRLPNIIYLSLAGNGENLRDQLGSPGRLRRKTSEDLDSNSVESYASNQHRLRPLQMQSLLNRLRINYFNRK